MSNVRLLRQSLEDYNNRIAKLDAQYSADYDAYAEKVNKFNNLPYVTESKRVIINPYEGGLSRAVKLSNGQSMFMPKGYENQRPGLGDRYLGSDTVTLPGSTLKGDPESAIPDQVIPERTVPLPHFGTDPSQYYGEPVNAPAQSTVPHSPSLTNNDYKAMANPGTDPAGVARDNALGYTGNSEIAALNDTPMRNSAFSDPEDPQGLKERGILARTLGGQL